VLQAAGTKWNFLKFHPGLVGGHCIGVDPYYLTAKAEELGYHPEVILSGRRVNDGMGAYVGQKIAKFLALQDIPLRNCRVGILGFTFKENVPDIRNSKVVDIYRELASFGIEPIVHDPLADNESVREEYGVSLAKSDDLMGLHALVLAVPHEDYKSMGVEAFQKMVVSGGTIIDVKSILNRKSLRSDINYWSL
jgi:UDP-N-acetyl-D-galactosamine dehydrogenase